jgi:pimeloyl-ACP methyl ester carboxylesterase
MTSANAFGFSSLCLIATIGVGASNTATTAAQPSTKPSIVLVHGAFVDASSWAPVTAILQRDGYNVTAVQAPLTSLAADVQATRRVIDAQTGPVVLVGHSWGGAVITDAAAADRVKALVYVAAFAPDAAEPVGAHNEKFPSRLGPALRADAGGFLTVDRAQFHELFARDLDPVKVRVAASSQKPILGSAFGDAPAQAAWRTIPSSYVVALDDQAIHPDLQRFFAQRMKARTSEIKASHSVLLSRAADVARVIAEAAQLSNSGSQQ